MWRTDIAEAGPAVDANVPRGGVWPDLNGTVLQGSIARLSVALEMRMRALSERLRATTPRERLLLAVLALGALIYAPIMAGDFRAAQEERYVQALGERASAQLAQSAARRIAAATENRSAVDDMRTWGFEAANIPIAQVSIEQRLLQAVTAAELVNPRITVRDQIENVGATQWLEAEVQADLRWTPVFAFLDDVAAWPEGFRVTRFQYEITPYTGFLPPETAPPATGQVRIGLAFPVTVTDSSDGRSS